MLLRGFTTVRDVAGADGGHREAVERGLFVGPRLFVAVTPCRRPAATATPAAPATCARRIGRAGHRRRRRRGQACGARQPPPRRRPHQADGLRRHLVADGPAREHPVHRGRDPRGDRGGRERRHVCLGPRVQRRGRPPRGRVGRAHDRAREPDRRGGGDADGRQGRDPRADALAVPLGDDRGRGAGAARVPRREGAAAVRGLGRGGRARPASTASRSRSAPTSSRRPTTASRGNSSCARSRSRRSTSCGARRSSAPRSSGSRASSARSCPARSPTCSPSRATRSRT